MIGYAIGNGLSRRGMNLENLEGPVVACNRGYTDVPADYVVAFDWNMRNEIGRLPERTFKLIATTARYSHLTVDGEPVMPLHEVNGRYGKNSGIIAAAFLAKILECDPVYLIGFDFFRWRQGDTCNDIYGGLHKATGMDVAMVKLAQDCDTKFIRVGPMDLDIEGLTYKETL